MTQDVLKTRLSHLPALLQQKEAARVLLVTGRHLLVEDDFCRLAFGMPTEILHPPDGLLQWEEIPQKENFDWLVAIGGGKTIDFAKGILYRCGSKKPFLAVPTTAGSGSEATPFAVLYQGQKKISLDQPWLLPQTVLLDAGLLHKLPGIQRAISGADAFAQCIESLWNRHSANASEGFATAGLQLLQHHLAAFVAGDNERSGEVQWAAHLSGKAIAHTRTTGPHALSYYLTARYGVPHGQAVAVFLPLFFLYNRQTPSMEKLFKLLKVRSAEEAFAHTTAFLSALGLATNFPNLGLSFLTAEEVLRSVNQQRFSNNPQPFEATELKALIQRYLL